MYICMYVRSSPMACYDNGSKWYHLDTIIPGVHCSEEHLTILKELRKLYVEDIHFKVNWALLQEAQ